MGRIISADEYRRDIHAWIDYVPSESNPADVPSRAHELKGDERLKLLSLGTEVPMTIPTFATPDGRWLPMVDIAKSVWQTGYATKHGRYGDTGEAARA